MSEQESNEFSMRELLRGHINDTREALGKSNEQLNQLNVKLEKLITKSEDKDKLIDKHEEALIELDRHHHEQKGAFWLLGVITASLGGVLAMFARKIFHL